MGLINFGASNSNGALFSRIKPVPTPNIQRSLSGRDLPVVRSGGTTYFSFNSGTEILLVSGSSGATIATITATTYLASGVFRNFHLSSADTCLYCVISDGAGNARLIKISDSSGTVTPLGASFSVSSSWNFSPENSFVERVSDVLKIITNGKYHEVTISTGSLLSEDTVISAAGYNLSTSYISASNSIYVEGVIKLSGKSSIIYHSEYISAPTMAKSGVGIVSGLHLPVDSAFGSGTEIGVFSSSTTNVFPIVSIDNDKLAFFAYTNISTPSLPVKVCLRSSYDAFLQSVINYAAGV